MRLRRDDCSAWGGSSECRSVELDAGTAARCCRGGTLEILALRHHTRQLSTRPVLSGHEYSLGNPALTNIISSQDAA
jgi:hypothetical protein